MCGRFILTTSSRQLADAFELAEEPVLVPRYNVAPSQPIAAIRVEADGRRRLSMLRWGLIPSWAKDPAIAGRTINARSETAAEKPAFRSAFRRRRCVVPADGFYEWKGRGRARHPLLLRRPGRGPFGIAGLWEEWISPEGEVVESCTLLTTEANAFVRPIHHRMPVLFDPADCGPWLDPDACEPEAVVGLLRPCPDDWLDATRVSDRVNRPTFDDPACLEPVPEPLELFSE